MTLLQNYHRLPVQFVKAQNTIWEDDHQQQYLDLSSGIGVYNIGARHPEVEAALIDQAQQLWHLPNLYDNALQEKVAEQLGGQNYAAYFANSGAEANEAAIKLARIATKKATIITFKNSFHGRTYAAMAATGQDTIHHGMPMAAGFKYATFNDIQNVEAIIDDNVAAIMFELVQGEGGVIPADQTFIKDLAQLAHQHHILLIIDEVQTGIGRTGTKFAYEQYAIEPDIITSAKSLANGLPVGAMLAKNNIADAFSYGVHGSTFGGNPLVMRSAIATLSVLDTLLPELPDKVKQMWSHLKLLQSLDAVIDIRGLGMIIGIALHPDVPVAEVVEKLLFEEHVITLSAGQNTLRLLPPLTITPAEMKTGIEKIHHILQQYKND
ncbi:aminotransferase class III-fold pyridoxal phosphate-dependent enzyme [Leuconostoc fallax]|uniref:aminotransferase class III-fold pyridoxal phosphate-dependent enzyme n=1 Tax=Leuconostoc fallax TaxID=1251 RepID=UPI00209103B3|nr:aminotransferase class III-fold pyridoxal phosphate-dependent enzyme [Leuconostoc fallax]MCO6184149.1 aminotransferase class III-fold pyridoxal phosphate-dependent enzyme [Leuconostoc fallax]